MKKIHGLAENSPLIDNEALIKYEGQTVYVGNYGADGFRFHSNPFLSEWYDTLETCTFAAIEHLFSSADILVLLEKFMCFLLRSHSTWAYKHSGGRLTIITPHGSVAVVDMSLKVIHATDDDIQCSVYGFIESVKPYKK